MLQHFRESRQLGSGPGRRAGFDPAGRRVLASSAPQGAAGLHGWAPEVIGAIGTPKTSPEKYLDVFLCPVRFESAGR
jgi:hypothetical protein